MKAVALVRYLAADALRAERWVPPVVLFLVTTVAGTSVGGTALGCYGFSSTVLLPVALWLTVSVVNSQDPVQTAITTVTAGSALAVRIAELAVAYLVCLGLAAFAVLYPLLTSHPAGRPELLAGVAGHLLTALAGVAFGSVLTRPLLSTPAWVVLSGVAVVLAELLVPGLPPFHPVGVLFSEVAPSTGRLARSLVVAGIETAAGAVLLVGLGHALSRRRT